MKGSYVFGALALLVTLGVGAGAASAAGVYKWVDEQGKVHYGDKPQGKDAETGDLAPPPPSAPPPTTTEDRAEKQRRLLDAYADEREQKQKEAEKKKAEKAEADRKCALAKDRLRRFQRAGYLYELDEKGERQILSDADRAKETREAEADVKKWCK